MLGGSDNYLRRSLERLIGFLREAGEVRWVGELTKISQQLGDMDTAELGMKTLRSQFGGMGSLNDYVFHPQNHNVPLGASAVQLNRKLSRLVGVVYRELCLASDPRQSRNAWRWREFKRRFFHVPRARIKDVLRRAFR